jgi:uncharacterized membrane protein YGL010W
MRRRRIDALLFDYGASHTTRGNLACHAAGITLIVLGILSMLQALPVAGVWTASEVLIAAGVLFYLALDPRLGLAVALAAVLLDLAARWIGDWRAGAAAFALGWIFQAIGHGIYEKNSPAFFRNLVHLLVGPAYLVNEALHIRPTGSTPK